ncbi:MAG: chorismate mutase [Treponema sp.]|nr:chorismate mutase [Treponema sp.]
MGEKILRSIRGAVCAENTVESIINNVGDLCRTLFRDNRISGGEIVNVQFTVTQDLDEINPATAFRRAKDLGIDASAVPLFCSQEPAVRGMLPRVVRIMVTAYMDSESKIVPVYINGAEKLRPDLAGA